MFMIKFCRNRSCGELMRDIRGGISKTAMNKNSFVTCRAQSYKKQQNNLELYNYNIINSRGMEQMHHNDIRTLSTIKQTAVGLPQYNNLASEEEYKDFMAMFPDIVREVTDVGASHELTDVMNKFARVLHYNAPTGVQLCGMIIISAYKLLEDPQKLTPENIKLANILGWCVEMMHATFIMIDDIVDHSETRRGSPCWYRLPEIRLSAINDACMIQKAAFVVFKKYFRDHPAYIPLMELFHDIMYETFMGQNLDVILGHLNEKPPLEKFTMDGYTSAAKYKSGCFFFKIPVDIAICLSGMKDEEQRRQAMAILLEMGIMYQIQNDFLDCFGDLGITARVGSDIQSGKCTWLAVKALERATPAQWKIMEEHYGRFQPVSISIIHRLYEDMGLPNIYAAYEVESFNTINMKIQQVPEGPVHNLLLKILGQIHKRVYVE